MPQAGRRRTHEQLSRQFLSSAYRCHSTSGICTFGNPRGNQSTTAYQISLEGLRVPESLVAVTLAIFNPQTRQFFGAKHRVNVSNIDTTKVIVLAPPQSQIVVEGLAWDDDDGGYEPGAPILANEKAKAFGAITLTSLPSYILDLNGGTSQLLLLEPHLRPPQQVYGNITIKMAPQSPDYQSTLAALLPVGCFAPAKFMDRTPLPLKHFDVNLDNLFVRLAPDHNAQDAFPRDNQWQMVLFAHNGFTQVSGRVIEVPLVKTADDMLKADPRGVSLELKELPLHSATSLVCGIRMSTRMEPFRTIGFSVVPLVSGSPISLKDSDIQIRNVPTLRGPHSGPDHRTLSNESEFPFAVMVFRVQVDIAFNKCPVKADEVKEIVQPGDQLRNSISKLGSSIDAIPTNSSSHNALPPRAPSPDGAGRPPLSGLQPNIPSTKPDEPLQDAVAGSETVEIPERKAVKGNIARNRSLGPEDGHGGDEVKPSSHRTPVDSEALPQLYDMLKNIAEEVRLVHGRLDEEKSQQQRFRDAMQTGEYNTNNNENPGSYNTGVDGNFVSGVEIVDLDLKRTSITHATRAQLMERVVVVNHPVTNKLLINGFTSASQPLLPLSQFGLRFDGLTLPLHQGDTPGSLMVEANFGLNNHHYRSKSLPLHHVAADAAAGRTYSVGSGTADSILWLEAAPEEAISVEQEAMMNGIRNKNVLYLRIYDAETQFYYASASIPLTHFHRAPSLAAVLRPKDLPIFVDTTLAMVSPDQSFFPLMTSQGQMHVTLITVGHTRPTGNAAADFFGDGGQEPVSANMNGFSAPKRITASSGQNGGMSIIASGGPLGSGGVVTPNIVVVPKVDLDFGLPTSSATDRMAIPEGMGGGQGGGGGGNAKTPGGMLGAASTTTLHAQRAAYIKKVLQENGGKMPPGQQAKVKVQVDQAELEFKLSYADKKKDEIRSAKIASHLKGMVTTPLSLCVARGRPETLRCPFTNPYPVSSTFSVEVLEEDVGNLRLHSKQAPAVHLGPKESTLILLVANHDFDVMLEASPSALKKNTRHIDVNCSLFSERREVVRIFSVKMECVLPLVDRTFDIFGQAGQRTSKFFFSRTFNSGALHGAGHHQQNGHHTLMPPTADGVPLAAGVYPGDGVEDLQSLTGKIGRLCRYPVVSHDDVIAETLAGIDPITRSKATAWESVAITVEALPTRTDEQRKVYVYLYEDSSCESLWETWEVTLSCCLTRTVDDAQYGQTNSLAVPIRCDRAYCSATNVVIGEVHNGQLDGKQYIVLRAKPRGQGIQAVVVHAQTGNSLERYLLYIPTVLPQVKDDHLALISVPAAEAGQPIFRRLPFKNDLLPPRQVVVNVTHNYHQYATISPSRFACGIEQSTTLAIRLEGLSAGEHGAVVKYPLWIFLNDNTTDVTLDVFLVEVLVGGVTPMIR